jgi:hypothetical protein
MSLALLRGLHRQHKFVRQLHFNNFCRFANLRSVESQKIKTKHFLSDKKDDKSGEVQKSLVKATEKLPLQQKYSRENVRQYFFMRLFNYIGNYDKVNTN